MNQPGFNVSVKKISAVVLAVVGAIVLWTSIYRVDATEVIVFQKAFIGTLSVESNPGSYFRMGAGVQEYRKQDNYSFEYIAPTCQVTQQGQVCTQNPNDRSIQVQFNDGGKAKIGGNVQWEMPQDQEHVLALHVLYGSQQGVDQALMRNAINRAMTFTAPLMSATESYAVRKAEFLQMFADQLENGIYQSQTIDTRAADPITGEMKTVKITSIIKDPKTGLPLHAEESPLKKYGITIQAPTITHMVYETKVEEQIQQQRDNILAIQTAQAQAKKAEQAAITAAKNGEANAMEAKWAQEVLKAKAVTQAEQEKAVAELNAARDLSVATLAAKTAEQYKYEQIKIGEGDSARKQLVMQADGALQQKLDTYLQVQTVWANAFKDYRGAIVPNTVMGSSGSASNGAQSFMDLMTAKAAKDLTLDTSTSVRKPAQ